MKVPIADLPRQHVVIADELYRAIEPVIKNQTFILGSPVRGFEAVFAAMCDVPHAVGVASGTDALVLSLRALGIGAGDAVVTTPFSFIATAEAIAAVGARPLFADIDETSLCLSPEALSRCLASMQRGPDGALRDSRSGARVKAVLPVHLFGHPAPMGALLVIARDYGLFVVEDAAQAVLTKSEGRVVGAFGDLGAFSFFPTKNLGGWGDGGAVVTKDENLAARVRSLRQHGMSELYEHVEVGMNSRLDALQATVLSVKAKHLDSWTSRRESNAARYRAALAGIASLDLPPEPPEGGRHTYHHFVLRTSQREALRHWLTDREIEARVYYPLPLHLQRCFASLGGTPGDHPVAERAAHRVLAIPVAAELDDAQLDHVIESVRSFFAR